MYFLIFCVDSNLAWIDNKKPVADQFNEIARYKILTKPRDLCKNRSKFLQPLCSYVFKLNFKEEPDYARMMFLLQKALLDRQLLPGPHFDWSLLPGQNFRREDDRQLSISSCEIASTELQEAEGKSSGSNSYLKNITAYQQLNEKQTNLNEPILSAAAHKINKLPSKWYKKLRSSQRNSLLNKSIIQEGSQQQPNNIVVSSRNNNAMDVILRSQNSQQAAGPVPNVSHLAQIVDERINSGALAQSGKRIKDNNSSNKFDLELNKSIN